MLLAEITFIDHSVAPLLPATMSQSQGYLHIVCHVSILRNSSWHDLSKQFQDTVLVGALRP